MPPLTPCSKSEYSVQPPAPALSTTSQLDSRAIIEDSQASQTDKTAQTITPVASSTPATVSSWYKGMKVDKNWLLNSHSCLSAFQDVVGKRSRPMVKCLTCQNYESEARKLSLNGTVPIAFGIPVHNSQGLLRVIDHLLSRAHKATAELQRKSELWEFQSDKHPWVKTLKKHRAEVTEFLVKLAVDVYNDCQVETPTAWSWPSRSLANLHSDSLNKRFVDHGWDTPFVAFGESDVSKSSLYHYRDPTVYREMLEVVANVERQNISNALKGCVSYGIQIDGSVDKQQLDNKFIVARYMPNTPEVELKTVFLGVVEAEQSGAKGLLQCIISVLSRVSAPLDKLTGISTDGESANTGRNGGLWKLVSEHTGRDILTVWCACHRSDLAMESIEACVAELGIWKVNLKAMAQYFRVSGKRTKKLSDFAKADDNQKPLHFPRFFEVRFAEHLKDLLAACLSNLNWCRSVWESLQNEGERREKAEATGFLNTWKSGSMQLWLSGLMFDVCCVFTSLEKGLQKSDLILPDVVTLRDGALRKLELMKDSPFPGGMEEKYDLPDTQRAHGARFNKFVTTSRSAAAVRTEIVAAATNFLQQRLNIEADPAFDSIQCVCTATDCSRFISGSEPLLKAVRKNDLANYAADVCDQWSAIASVPLLCDSADTGTRYSVKLRHLLSVTTGLVREVLSAAFVTCPHSMSTERAVSHYNLLKSAHRQSMTNETITDKLSVALNGTGTAFFDPRPCVAEFLLKKERKYQEPTCALYKNRAFVKKFFRKTSSLS